MIATLTGKITEKFIDTVVLDVSGIGYEIFVTLEDYSSLIVNEIEKVYVYEYIREQSYDLFGFKKLDTKRLFIKLLGVNGVGPKMALNILSIGNSNEVKKAIASGDTKYIQQANGVGKKVAERVIIELKDKLGLDSVDLATTGILQSENLLTKDEAVEALISLGYTPQDASLALKNIDPSLSLEKRITLVLKG
jgi:Holliday junction DNA helicase RuvA